MHAVADMLTAAAEAVLAPSSTSATGTASIPEPISPIHPTPTWSHPHPHPGPPGWPEGITFDTIGHLGHVTAWVVFGIYALTLLAFLFSTVRKPLPSKLLSLLLLAVSIVSASAYFSFATGLGSGFLLHSSSGVLHARQVVFGHFLQWAFTTPLLLSILGNLAGLPALQTLLIALSGTATEIFSGIGTAALRGHGHGHGAHGHAHAHHGPAWAWLIFSALPFLYIVYVLLLPGRHSASLRSPGTGRLYTLLALWTINLFAPYPILLILGPYLNILSPKGEFLGYALLDLLTQVVFGFGLLFGLRRHPEAEAVLGEQWVVNGGGYAYEPVAQEESGAVPVAA
ncbi:family A G protein-coupled receptor-like protein [Calocera viscosa TUFC12733]|uniref:Family A G protein-coupled receptor-like protein n=1 Tax=Calocera viscosa (strain TUFC12733) TaxID=1330018 RepID=A0A167JJB1_CALVF|nr:family A G protein-coupled receptor-like protein [Calocera viscosa TUFC12733]